MLLMDINVKYNNQNYSFKIDEKNIIFNKNMKKYVFNLDVFIDNKKYKTENLLAITSKPEDIIKSAKIYLEYVLI